MCDTFINIVGVVNSHVPAIAATLVKQSTRCGVVCNGGDNLQKLIPDAEQSIVQSELGNAGISVNDINIKRGGQVPDGLLKVASNEGYLADSNHFHTLDGKKPL
jgi:hypothetical protein